MADSAPSALLWRCRRGMKELDLLLERFAREGYGAEAPAGRCAFERLLDLPDPLLVELLLTDRSADGSAAQALAGDVELERIVALVAGAGRR